MHRSRRAVAALRYRCGVLLGLLLVAVPLACGPGSRPQPLGVSIDLMRTGHPAVVVDGDELALRQGPVTQPWDFTGINAYQLTTKWGANDGCGWGGWTPATLDAFFAQLPANALIRTWFFQSDATTVVAGQAVRSWTALDQVIAAADKYNIHLVLTLGNQAGTCDDGVWKGPDWYAGGYRQVDEAPGSPSGPGVTSYAQWVHDAVSRYANSPAIAMWEPVNEPQPSTCGITPGWDCYGRTSCPSEQRAMTAVLDFYTTIGREIHRLSPGKLVSDGSFGGGACGTATMADFARVISSPGIDVVGYHDYSGLVNPPDLAPRSAVAAEVRKPTMIGEAGVTGCPTAADRASTYRSKIAAAETDGVTAYLAWWYDGDQGDPTCDSPIAPDSPAWPAIMDDARPSGFEQTTTGA